MPAEDKIIYILIASMSIVGIVVCYFIYSMIRLHGNYVKVREEQDKTKILAIEQERQLIAADLHDDIAQILAAVLFMLGEVDAASQRGKELLLKSYGHIDKVFQRIKKISTSLSPAGVERIGPLGALDYFISTFLDEYPLYIEVNLNPCKGLSRNQSLHIFRMLQEIVQNTIKHAKAKNLLISGKIHDNELVIDTEDDGVGFNVKDVEDNGLGLYNLKLRAEMINAKLEMKSAPGNGTAYKIKLSLQQ